MNYRDYKIFTRGAIFHVFNRGVARQGIYSSDADYSLFLRRIKEQVLGRPLPIAKKTDYHRKVFEPGLFTLYAYCLMPNHFHWLIKQEADVSISELVKRVTTGYSKVFNIKYERPGALFQDQFKAVRVETTEQLLWLSAYIHQNPKVAGLVQNLEDWQWSSYLDYAGLRRGELVDTLPILALPSFAANTSRYKDFVDSTYETIKARKDIEHLLLD